MELGGGGRRRPTSDITRVLHGGERMLPVRGLAEWNIRNDTKQAYPVATGLVRGSTP